MKPVHFSQDALDLLALLQKHRVRYLIVGAEAVIFYGLPRLTGDIDIFFDAALDNRHALFAALQEFWGGAVPEVDSPADLAGEARIIQFGFPPNRIDLINAITGVEFEEAWAGRRSQSVQARNQSFEIHFIGLAALIKNKEACGRPKDLEDLKYLRQAVRKAD